MSETMKPALTPEEWADFLAAPVGDSRPKWEQAREEGERLAQRAFAQKHQGLRPVITERPAAPLTSTEQQNTKPRGNLSVSPPTPPNGGAAA